MTAFCEQFNTQKLILLVWQTYSFAPGNVKDPGNTEWRKHAPHSAEFSSVARILFKRDIISLSYIQFVQCICWKAMLGEYSLLYLATWRKHMRMYACVCVTERERERGNAVSQQHPLKIHPSPPRHVAHSTARHLVTCVTHNRKKERRLQQKTQLRSHRKLAALPTGNDTVLKDFISGKPVFILRQYMFWVVATCGWVTASWVLKEHTVFIFCIHSYSWRWRRCVFLDCWEEITLLHCNDPEHLVPQQSLDGNLKSLFSYC